MTDPRACLQSVRRLVVKVGTRLVTGAGAGLDLAFLSGLAEQVELLRRRERQVVLVTSGAVYLGRRRLGLKQGSEDISLRQAAAAVGQPELMHHYMAAFSARDITTAQMLLTRDDIEDRHRYVHLRNTLERLLQRGVVPIINENDSVSVEGVTFVENDLLAAFVAIKVRAEALVFLSDQEGLFTADPRNCDSATLVPVVRPTDDVSSFAREAGGPESSGGMIKKCEAAQLAAGAGIPAVLVNGREPNVVPRVLEGEELGTLFVSERARPSRKVWIATAPRVSGELVVDAGACRALTRPDGSSLLPIGIIAVRGKFQAGDLVRVVGPEGEEVARGLANYPSEDIERIRGHHTADILQLLGHVGHTEVIHRDNMVVG